MSVRTRFAPSPTGSLHVGGVRTALYCWLHARKMGGRFILRIEDTDVARSSEEAARGIVRDLRWLGLNWDEGPEVEGPHGPYRQSEKLERYRAVVQDLLDRGLAYEAWESREDLAELRAAAAARKEGFTYRRRDYREEELQRFRDEGRRPVVRLQVPTHQNYLVDDRIVGEVEVSGTELEDVVLLKADGYPTYHLAVVVDDQDMRISDVLRGQEHLKNTHRHQAIARAIGWSLPRMGHLPIIFNPGGSKMSKRDKARAARAAVRSESKSRTSEGLHWLAEATELPLEELDAFMRKEHSELRMARAIASALQVELPRIDVRDFLEGGYLPEALLNYLALLGWSPGDDRELMSLQEMVEAFDLGRVGRTPARFDPDKLLWMNAETLRRSSPQRLRQALADWIEAVPTSHIAQEPVERQHQLLELYAGRYQTFADLEQRAIRLLQPPTSWAPRSVKKHLRKGNGFARLRLAREALAAASWQPEAIEAALKQLCEDKELRMGKVAQPVRIAVTGGPVSPPIHSTLGFLSQAETLRRIDSCLQRLTTD